MVFGSRIRIVRYYYFFGKKKNTQSKHAVYLLFKKILCMRVMEEIFNLIRHSFQTGSIDMFFKN